MLSPGLRSFDLRTLQSRLAHYGLSSLGRVEAHVMASLDAVIGLLAQLTGQATGPALLARGPGFDEGADLLVGHAEALFGPAPAQRDVRIMVTLPTEAADDGALVHGLMAAGMDCARINCAHDGPEAWSKMIRHLRQAEAAHGRRCCLMMDLGGHKIRTGPITTMPGFARIKPLRDRRGRTTAPATLYLAAEDGRGGNGQRTAAKCFLRRVT